MRELATGYEAIVEGVRERLLLLLGTLSAGRDGSDWVVVAKVTQ